MRPALSSNTAVALTAAIQHLAGMGKPGKSTKGLGWRIAQARNRAGLTQTALSKSAGVTRSAVSQWESDTTEPTPQNLRTIAVETKIRYDWLATGRGQMFDDLRSEDVAAELADKEPDRALQVAGYIGANGLTGFYALAQDRYETIPAYPDDPPGAVALEIMGTSAGRWFDRWYAVITDKTEGVTPDMIGQPCVVWLPDDRILFKEIRRNGALFDLISNDPTEPPIRGVRIKAAALVHRIVRR